MKNLLNIKKLHVEAEGKEILKGLDLSINKGEVHVIMGPNGAGKSTLANSIMGHPLYSISSGNILFENKDIVEDKINERASKGIFLSFQNPEEVEGITVENFLRAAKIATTGEKIGIFKFRKELHETMDKLNFSREYASRYLNFGFSGGEKKKNEVLQMLILNPKLAILDETDSGLDVDAVKTVSKGIDWYKNENNGVLIITHNAKLLESITPDYVHILIDGKIVKTGNSDLMNEVINNGFASLDIGGE